MKLSPRLKREFNTIQTMVKLYCKDHHQADETDGSICSDCKNLMEYAKTRLTRCPFQEHKPTCGKCTIHCYQPKMRNKVVEIMRYSGPKMILKNPVMAIQHLLDSFKEVPSTPKRRNTL